MDSSQVIDFLLAATPCQCLVPFVTLSSRQEPFLTPGSPAPRSSRFNSLTPRPAPDWQRDPHAATREVAPPGMQVLDRDYSGEGGKGKTALVPGCGRGCVPPNDTVACSLSLRRAGADSAHAPDTTW